jgi:sulfate transport system ATP-binding protein
VLLAAALSGRRHSAAAAPAPASAGPLLRRRGASVARRSTAPAQEQQQQQQQSAADSANGNSNGSNGSSAATRPPAALATSSLDADANGPEAGANGYDGVAMPPRDATSVLGGLTVRVRGMVKHFPTAGGRGGVFRAVDGVDVDIEPSSIVALLGPSGSGKTTLLRLIAGLEEPTAGKILFDDEDATGLSVQDRQVGMVFQSYALFNHKTVAQNVRFGLEVRDLPIDRDKRVADLLQLVQLTGLGDRYPRQLSGGQRQRVALARALASNPRLLLLDEPFGALDAVVRKQLRSGLKEIVRSVGVTTVIVTHDQEEAFDLADKVVVFNRGLIEQQGPPRDIIRRPLTPFVMKFVGETCAVPSTSLLVRRARFQTDKPWVMFRPGDLRVSAATPTSAAGAAAAIAAEEGAAAATVADRADLGWIVRYTLRFDDDVDVEYAVSLAMPPAVDSAQAAAAGPAGAALLRPLALDIGQRVFVSVRPGAMMGYDKSEVESAPVLR